MTTQTQEQTREVRLPERTIILQVTCRGPSAMRVGNKTAIQTDANKNRLKLRKSIFECKEFKKATSHFGRIRDFCRARGVPAPLLKDGMYAIPLALVEDTLNRLQEKFDEGWELIENFLEVYVAEDGPVANDRKELGSQFNAGDYPTVDELRAAFGFEFNLLSFETPDRLNTVSGELFRQEQEKMERSWREAEQVAFQALREQFAKLVGHMADRLTPEDDGSRKIFRKSMVDNFAEFLETFNARNISDDAELDKYVAKCRKLLEGVNDSELRDNEGMRAAVQTGMSKVQANMDKLLVAKPKRRIRFNDTE